MLTAFDNIRIDHWGYKTAIVSLRGLVKYRKALHETVSGTDR